MFKIKHTQNKETKENYLELSNQSIHTYAKIFLDQGASLQELILNNITIIKNLHPISYTNSVASGILFPFASRIKDGIYTFQQKKYELEINEKERNNAIHGFVFNKTFEIIEQKTTNLEASVKVQFTENNETKGFPFKYSVQLHYTLTAATLNLAVSIANNDRKPFPFTLGWHPYFYSSDLYNSYLSLNTSKKIYFDDRMILNNVKDIVLENNLQIKDNKLDDCYILNNNEVRFKTPDYEIEISTTCKENYLQIYTPDNNNTIAIEPCTGTSNSFNNQFGLQVLEPKQKYHLTWNIDLK